MKKITYLLIVLFSLTGMLFAEEKKAKEVVYLKVTVTNNYLYMQATINSETVAELKKDEIFSVYKEYRDWYAVSLFSKIPRYISKSAVTTTNYQLKELDYLAKRRLFQSFTRAEIGCQQQAHMTFPNNYSENLALRNLLYDRVKLRITRQYNLNYVDVQNITKEGIKNRWLLH